ncbi:hypothetical protein A2U01_0087717, partial [Trifolium medium]|nr:hypothetical protein [Trifolium medium]
VYELGFLPSVLKQNVDGMSREAAKITIGTGTTTRSRTEAET